MKFFEKIEDQVVVKFDHGRLVLASIGAALFVALVFLMGVLVGKALWSHPAGSILATTAEQMRVPVSDEPRPGASKLDFYVDVKRPAGEVSAPDEMKARVTEEKPSPTMVVPTVPPPSIPMPDAAATLASADAKQTETAQVVSAPAPKPAPAPPKTVTTVTTAAPVKTAPPPTPARTGYSLQIESYQERSKAESAKKKLASRGIATEISLSQVNGVNWYRLQANGFPTREAAEKFNRETLKPKGFNGYIISR